MSEEEHKWPKNGANTSLPKGEFNIRGSLNVLLKIFYWGHRPLRLAGCSIRSIGWRSANDWSATIGGLVVLLVWAEFTRSTDLLYIGGGVAVLAEILHRVYPGTGHSRYFGDNGWKLKNNLHGHLLTSGLAILGGLALMQYSDRGFGSYLIFAGTGYATWALFLTARERHMVQDQLDAEYLSQAMDPGRRE